MEEHGYARKRVQDSASSSENSAKGSKLENGKLWIGDSIWGVTFEAGLVTT